MVKINYKTIFQWREKPIPLSVIHQTVDEGSFKWTKYLPFIKKIINKEITPKEAVSLLLN